MMYTGKNLKEIVFPLGGIGSGSIGIAGNGCLVDWEIFNRPNKGSINAYSFFAVKAVFPNGKTVVKALQGDWTRNLMGQYAKSKFCGYGFGPNGGTLCGLPHFKKVRFNGKFPLATLTFEDDFFPAKVTLQAFNPFIPLDPDNSSIPAAFFKVKITSLEDNIKYSVLLSVRNPFEKTVNKKIENNTYTAVQMMHAGVDDTDKKYGDLTVAVNRENGIFQEYWYRGEWMDPLTTFWQELTDGVFTNRHYQEPGKGDVCTVGANETLCRKQSSSFHFVLSWNVPNCYNYWSPCRDENGNDITWKNYYATLFRDSVDSCFYSLKHWETLFRKTNRFCLSLHHSSLDRSIIDAISATLSVLKSPTVLRLEDGTFYGFEGLHEQEGSCEGSCTHVWSYAYALCFLFPTLERSLRETEQKYNTDKNGKMEFRTKLPLGRDAGSWHPCVDGQMATVIKIYRDFKITGDVRWLKDHWDYVKSILEFAWNDHNPYEWDKNKDGVLEGRQHHTLDMELFGPSSWLQSMYLAALKAAAEMAAFLGDAAKQDEYTKLFEKGRKWTKENLFNGAYYFQKVDLTDQTYTTHFHCPEYWNEEKGQLKYQIGEGCEIDQMLGQWHANICGLGDIFDPEQRRIALKNTFQNNYKKPLSAFANMWRVFALNDEGGTVICDYPAGSHKPVIPIPYCEECMTGFEYAFAGLLISEGFLAEGLQVVRSVRERYNGEKRNPFNEIECGSNYARAMASFALLPIFSGFEFNLPQKHIGFSPIVPGNFKCLWSLGTGWGDFIKTKHTYSIVVAAGSLTLNSITLGGIPAVKKAYADGQKIVFTQNKDQILLNHVTIRKKLSFEV